MRKGQKKRIWTAEQKHETLQKHLDELMAMRPLAKAYLAGGETPFEPKPHSGASSRKSRH